MSKKLMIGTRVSPEVYNYLTKMSQKTGNSMTKIINNAIYKAYEIDYKAEKYIFLKKCK